MCSILHERDVASRIEMMDIWCLHDASLWLIDYCLTLFHATIGSIVSLRCRSKAILWDVPTGKRIKNSITIFSTLLKCRATVNTYQLDYKLHAQIVAIIIIIRLLECCTLLVVMKHMKNFILLVVSHRATYFKRKLLIFTACNSRPFHPRASQW